MKNDNASAGQKLLQLWNKLKNKPMGIWVFNRIISWKIPYTGSIKAQVQQLSPGKARVELKQRKSNFNHLNSIHAIALSNLGELTSGLAMLCGLPESVRGIVTRIDTEYKKKARGHLTGIADIEIPAMHEQSMHYTIHANIKDAEDDTVAVVHATWLLSKK